MTKQLKTWTALGLAALGSATLAHATPLNPGTAPALPGAVQRPLILVDGEGGGEGGGSAISSYAIESTDPAAFAYDATPQVAAYVDLVKTAYARSAADARTMQGAIAAMLAAPTADTLAAARKAWVDARPAYLKTEAFRFYDGPIEEVEGALNAWPLNEAYIDYVEGDASAGLVNNPVLALSPETVAGLNQKQDEADVTTGWHAIEFLLWGQDLSATGPGNRPVSDFIAGQGNNDRRRAYLELVTAQLVQDLDGLAKSWDGADKAGFAARLTTLPPREAIGRMVNGMAILAGFEFMSERLGVALDSGDQEDEHSCFSDTTKQDFVYDLVGIKQVWTGDSDGASRPGLDELVRQLDAELAGKIDRLFADAEAKVEALGDPWDQVLAAAPGSPPRQAAEDLLTALQALASGLSAAGNQLGVLVLIPTG